MVSAAEIDGTEEKKSSFTTGTRGMILSIGVRRNGSEGVETMLIA